MGRVGSIPTPGTPSLIARFARSLGVQALIVISGPRPASRTVYFDAKTSGLALRVSPRGARTWVFVYRSGGRPP
jgi:hypothetical protein